MSDIHWVVTYAISADTPTPPVGKRVALDAPLVVGREGDMPVGVDVPDAGVSREALVVTATRDGWQLEVSNRNRAVVHPWGRPAEMAQSRMLINWPLVGIRVLGSVRDAQHWVLLESSLYMHAAAQGQGIASRAVTHTGIADSPSPLTDAELEALGVVFGPQLAWPPVVPATALQLKQAATRLGIGASAVQQRLLGVQQKAERLGMPRRGGGTTVPDYLYALVSAGYVPITTVRPPRRELPTTDPS